MRLFWHPQGEYLAVQVDRYTKTRKSTFTAFELFSVKERDIPMEVCALCKQRPPPLPPVPPHAWLPPMVPFLETCLSHAPDSALAGLVL